MLQIRLKSNFFKELENSSCDVVVIVKHMCCNGWCIKVLFSELTEMFFAPHSDWSTWLPNINYPTILKPYFLNLLRDIFGIPGACLWKKPGKSPCMLARYEKFNCASACLIYNEVIWVYINGFQWLILLFDNLFKVKKGQQLHEF